MIRTDGRDVALAMAQLIHVVVKEHQRFDITQSQAVKKAVVRLGDTIDAALAAARKK